MLTPARRRLHFLLCISFLVAMLRLLIGVLNVKNLVLSLELLEVLASLIARWNLLLLLCCHLPRFIHCESVNVIGVNLATTIVAAILSIHGVQLLACLVLLHLLLAHRVNAFRKTVIPIHGLFVYLFGYSVLLGTILVIAE
jgi:hypothetical protein